MIDYCINNTLEVDQMSYVIGIDGGGTKTTGVIADEKGTIIAEAQVGASNPNLISSAELSKTFDELKGKLAAQSNEAFNKADRVFAGISGTGHPNAKKKVTNLLADTMPAEARVKVDVDAIIALYSGTLGSPGIVQISGTGSITYGENGEGDRNRVGGWGHFIGEQGSGYGLGSDALEAAFAAYDGMGSPTNLAGGILDYFKETSLPNVIPLIYHTANPKEIIASLASLVFKAADEGEAVAKDIIQQNGLYIGQCISILIKKLFSRIPENESAIPVVLAGGLFNRTDLLKGSIEEGLKLQDKPVKLIIPHLDPVGGAVMAALKME